MSQRSRQTRDTWHAGDLWPPASPIDRTNAVVAEVIVPSPIVSVGLPQKVLSRPMPRSGATQLGLMPPPEASRSGARVLLPVTEKTPDLSEETRVGLPRIEPRAAPAIGERAILGRYQVLCRLARGGMGTVYLCRATGAGGFQRLFALKVLRRHLAKDPQATEMFLHEATTAGRIADPHVVGVVDVGMHDDQPYFVMDYVEGGSFQDLLQRHPRARPPRLIVPIVLDLLAGLRAAHGLSDDDGAPIRLVHCDVSPHNLLVGTDGTSRLSDFGVARIRAEGALSSPTMLRGKPSFISPEQASLAPIDHRTDLFSAGVVLFTALTGVRLFDGASREETLANVLSKPIPPASAVGFRPPACFDPICKRALERNPNDRYGTAQEMIDALRAAALEADLLAPTGEVGRWVSDTFGPELQARRVALVTGARKTRPKAAVSRSARPSGPAARTQRLDVGPPAQAAAPVAREVDQAARTVVLPVAAKLDRRKKVILVAGGVAVVMLFIALAWPDRIARFFTFSSDRAGQDAGAHGAPAAPVGARDPEAVRGGMPLSSKPGTDHRAR